MLFISLLLLVGGLSACNIEQQENSDVTDLGNLYTEFLSNFDFNIELMFEGDINNCGVPEIIIPEVGMLYYHNNEVNILEFMHGISFCHFYSETANQFFISSGLGSESHIKIYNFVDGKYELATHLYTKRVRHFNEQNILFLITENYYINNIETNEVESDKVRVFWQEQRAVSNHILCNTCDSAYSYEKFTSDYNFTYTIAEAPTEANKLLGEYMSANLQFVEKMFIDDINNDGELEIIFIIAHKSTLLYYYDNSIKELTSFMRWGEAHGCGGFPLYQNKTTGQVMAVDISSQLYYYRFYDFVDGDYLISPEFEFKFWVEWNPDPRNEDFPPWRSDKYSVNGEEVSEEQYYDSIISLINNPDWILLCPCNEDLPYVTLEDVNGDFTGYIEEKLGL